MQYLLFLILFFIFIFYHLGDPGVKLQCSAVLTIAGSCCSPRLHHRLPCSHLGDRGLC